MSIGVSPKLFIDKSNSIFLNEHNLATTNNDGSKSPCLVQVINDPAAWQSLYEQASYADLMQSWGYGTSMADTAGWKPERQVILYQGCPVAIAQVLVSESPLLGTMARVPHGPIFLQDDHTLSPDLVREVFKTLREYWVSMRQSRLSISPCTLASHDIIQSAALELGFELSSEAVWASIRIDISQSQEDLLAHFQQRWRTSLHKAQNLNLQSKFVHQNQDIQDFLASFDSFQKIRGFSWPSRQLIESLWSRQEIMCETVSIYGGSDLLLEVLCLQLPRTMFLFAMYATPAARKVGAMHFLIWQMLLHSQKAGLRWFDLGGIDEKNLPQLTYFKRGMLPAGEEYHFAGVFEAVPESSKKAASTSAEGKFSSLENDLEMIKQRVEAVLRVFLKATLDWDGLVPGDLKLITSGLVDSLSLLTLMAALQKEFSLELNRGDLIVENLNTVSAISEFIHSHKVG